MLQRKIIFTSMKKLVVVILLFTMVFMTFGNKVNSSNKLVFSENARETLFESELDDITEEPIVAVLNFSYIFESSFDRESLVEDSDFDLFLKNVRDEGKKQHEKLNSDIISSLLIDEYNVEISTYAPFASITFYEETPAEILKLLNEISSSLEISVINVINYSEEKPKIDTNFSRLGFDSYNTYSDYNGYDGTGVTIGILEAQEDGGGGIVDEDHANFVGTDLVIRNEWYYTEEESNHATLVASIAGGNSGIARGAKLLSVELSGSPYSEVDWMLDNDVNVVNMSFGSNHDGYYSLPYDAYYDYIARNYFVTFVAAAGNTGAELLSPGTAYNVITVGSTNDFDTISVFSSIDESFDIHKPNLVAPGSSIDVNGVYPSPPSGTSLAAPHVTGIIALMMERRSILKTHPELVNAILTANADSVDYRPYYNTYSYGGCTTTGCKGYEDSFGAGEVRTDVSIDNIYRTSYFKIDDNSHYRDNVRTLLVYLNVGDELTVSLFWMRNILVSQYVGYVPEPLLDLDLKLYNPNGYLVYSSNSTPYNNELITYYATQSGYYSIKVYQYGEFDEGNWLIPSDIDVYGAVAYKISVGS